MIRDFKEKAIYCKDTNKDEIENMPLFMFQHISRHKFNTHTFTVFLMNVQDLTSHAGFPPVCYKPGGLPGLNFPRPG